MDVPLWIKIIVFFTEKGTFNYEEFEKYLIRQLKRLDFEKQIIKKEFKKFDRNNDGFVDIEEITMVLTKCGKNPMLKEEVDGWLRSDAMKDDKLDYDGNVVIVVLLCCYPP